MEDPTVKGCNHGKVLTLSPTLFSDDVPWAFGATIFFLSSIVPIKTSGLVPFILLSTQFSVFVQDHVRRKVACLPSHPLEKLVPPERSDKEAKLSTELCFSSCSRIGFKRTKWTADPLLPIRIGLTPELIGSDSPSGKPTKPGTSNSISINNLEVWLSGLRHRKPKNVSAPALYGFLASPYLAGGRFSKKQRLITRIGSRIPVPKRMGEFGLSVHRSGASICSGGETRALDAFVAISFGRFLGSEVKDIMTTGRNLVFFAILI
ncbi:hypothetical protein M9H77_23657 [Catharanthus roseus]|uniref:Uncharacterized protein n=1 Tax=Catharanthus roseus TaxID=4058 RepID=A0ACC0AW25_CATRO|nr:hypothetical protein M9H77_23657 [Catharanthus roseus]